MTGRLYIEFCGEELAVAPGERLAFGRDADLVVDDNPYLHRVVGRFDDEGGSWWLRNLGRSVALTVLDARGTSSATVGPGSSAALVHPRFVVAFSAGPSAYELAGTLEDADRRLDLDPSGDRGGGATLDWGRVELNADQRALLDVLCEERLRRPADQWAPVPSNRAGAARLGWSLAKYNRKLDHLCEKLHRAGVRGLHGDLGLLAGDRRRLLVDHAVRVGLVGADDSDAA